MFSLISPDGRKRLCFPSEKLAGPFMESNTFKSMSIDELWGLREQVASILADRITAEQAKLEEQLRKIEDASNLVRLDHRQS